MDLLKIIPVKIRSKCIWILHTSVGNTSFLLNFILKKMFNIAI